MEFIRADLHLHSTASDGTWLPQQLVAAAKQAKLGAIAVTDHESVANVAETEAYARQAGVQFLRGVEISTTKHETCFHVLGYGIDITDRRLLELLNHNESLLAKKDEDSISILAEKGWPVCMTEFQSYEHDRGRGGWKALSYLQDKGLCSDIMDFFNRIFTQENALGFPVFPTIAETIDIIHNAGGVAILAHAASEMHGPGLLSTMDEMALEKFDGFECYHSGHNAEDTRTLLAYCQQNNLLISGGSDSHGDFVKSRIIGNPEIFTKNLNLPGLF
ncbi:MAG: PHP domain-containing protein [Acidaminococcaceae bacterium]